jgi:alkanesulfonate monooxygenase SsuD/methylene tetrahydromethanopterin reductase-like flavin-dependent oxidoreductase (luciferase family)
LAPLPVQRPIPVWFGAMSPAAYRRAGRLADGWFPQHAPGPKLDEARAIVERAALEAGRDPKAIGMEGHLNLAAGGVEKVAEQARRWRDTGATHLAVNTMGAGLASVEAHLAALAAVAKALEVAPR